MTRCHPRLLQRRPAGTSSSHCGVGARLDGAGLAAGRDGRRLGGRPAAASPTRWPRGPATSPPRPSSVIYLFMAGGPSQLELFDYKPELQQLDGQPIPESFIKGKRFAFMDTFAKETPKLLGTRPQVRASTAQSGRGSRSACRTLARSWTTSRSCRSMATESFNHAPAKLFMNTGSPQFGRPSMGAWVTYGIGSESQDLPGFVVLQSGPRGPRGGALHWGSGFLPTTYQGVPFRTGGEPILEPVEPARASPPSGSGEALDAIRDLNRRAAGGDRRPRDRHADRLLRDGVPDADQRPGADRPRGRDARRRCDLYGAEPGKPSFANNCLLARRLVERGVRFVQLYHTDWDHHGGPGENLGADLDKVCREIDRPLRRADHGPEAARAARRHAGRLGRRVRPHADGRDPRDVGRNHHIDAFTMWMAGGGIKPGLTARRSTDEFGFAPSRTASTSTTCRPRSCTCWASITPS